MKKILIITIIMLITVTSVMSAPLLRMVESKISVGASFGTSGSTEKSSDPDLEVANSSKFGFVVRLRGDYRFAEDYTATLMLSYDSPSKAVIINDLRGIGSGDPKYIKIFLGASRHFVANDNLLVAIGVGPELSIDLNNGAIGAAATVYGRFSYRLEGSNILFDSTVKGSMEWIKDLPDKDTHFYLDGDVSLGFTYMF